LKKPGARVDWVLVNASDIMPVSLLLLIGLAVGTGTLVVLLLVRHLRRRRPAGEVLRLPSAYASARSSYARRPSCWLAIKSRDLLAVQSALGLHNPKPCSWMDGLAGEDKLFISPPVNGWILVIGSGLPDPSDDVDACFRFVLGLSRKLGQVQFFSASRVLQHHAWVRADHGHVVRAYAWAGKTIWKQGARTPAEKELDLECFDYGEPAGRGSFGEPDVIGANVDRVPLLAARWSLDPAGIDERCLEQERGIAGEPSRRY